MKFDVDHFSESDLRALFEGAPACLLILTPELQIAGVSDAYLAATMTRRAEIVGRALFDVFPDDPKDPSADGTRNLRASLDRVTTTLAVDEMPIQRYAIRREDGSFETRYWAPSNKPVLGPDGRLRWIIHHVIDVTRRVEAETAAKALALGPESTMAAFFDGIFEGVQIIDRDGRYVYLNTVAVKQGRRRREELIGQRMSELYPGIEQTEFYGLLQDCLATRQPHQITNHFTYPDGNNAWFELRIEPVPVGALILSQDITDRVRLEESVQATGRLEAVGRLAGGIAHDFNNLITVISGYAAVLQEGLPPADPKRTELATIQSAAARAADLTRQLLAFSRKQVLQPKVLDLNTSLDAVVQLLRRVIGEDIELVMKPSKPLDRIRVDPGQLEQIIMNLALNARDAMPQGGKLTLESANVDLDQAYCDLHPEAKPGRHVMLAVSDNGVGMDAPTQARIFEPFFFSTKGAGRGTGLGLATVHGIVKQSGGNIWVYSEPQRGTTFKVHLPSCSEPLSPLPPGAESPFLTPAGHCILLVEDEPGVRGLFETVLRRAGYQVLSARDAEEALLVSGQHAGAIDLLLTDVVLPGMRGKQLAQSLQEQRPGLKIVYMSGYTDNAIVHQGILDEGTAFINKPISPAQLLKKLAGYLNA